MTSTLHLLLILVIVLTKFKLEVYLGDETAGEAADGVGVCRVSTRSPKTGSVDIKSSLLIILLPGEKRQKDKIQELLKIIANTS
jgi:hypothetical protein